MAAAMIFQVVAAADQVTPAAYTAVPGLTDDLQVTDDPLKVASGAAALVVLTVNGWCSPPTPRFMTQNGQVETPREWRSHPACFTSPS